MGGKGKDPFKQLEEDVAASTKAWTDNPIDKFLDVTTNFATAGIKGYKGDGEFGGGLWGNMIHESVGELNGSNATRDQIMDQEDALVEEEKSAKKAFSNELAVRATNDLAASNAAGSARRRGSLGGKRDILGI